MKARENHLSILRFWRDVEIFDIPTIPKNKAEGVLIKTLAPEEALPWTADKKTHLPADKGCVYRHWVFLGVAKTKFWAKVVLEAAAPGERLSPDDEERIRGDSWLAAFMVDEAGRPIADSYVPASFALGVARLKQDKALDGLSREFEEARQGYNKRYWAAKPLESAQDADMSPDKAGGRVTSAVDVLEGAEDADMSPEAQAKPLDWVALLEEIDLALAPLGIHRTGTLSRVTVKSVRFRQSGRPSRDDEIDYLNSFYLGDLDGLIDVVRIGGSFGRALSEYLSGSTDEAARQDVLTDPVAMAARLRPEKFSAGRWPAKPSRHLMLAQQAAVAESVSQLSGRAGLITVNGPPGTGKTTMLRDIIADVVVRRATLLAGLRSPWQAFLKKVSIGGMSVYPPKIANDTGIVVASSNNTAVENITRELPVQDESWASDFPQAAYFPEVAANLFKEAGIDAPAWGLVAAVLGKSENRRNFIKGLFFQDSTSQNFEFGVPSGMKALLEFWSKRGGAAEKGWSKARRDFLELKSKIDEKLNHMVKLQELLDQQQQLAQIQSTIARCQAELNSLPERWAGRLAHADQQHRLATAQLESARDRVRAAELRTQAADDRLRAEEQSKPPFWERWLEIVGLQTRRVKSWRAAVAPLKVERAENNIRLSEALTVQEQARKAQQVAAEQLEEARRALAAKEEHLRSHIENLRPRVTELEQKLAAGRKHLESAKTSGMAVPDAEFFAQGNEQRHLSSVWVTPELDHLRAELLLAALRLHEWTIRACAGKYIANLRAIKNMLLDDTPEPLSPDDRRVLWNTLFFLVPVVSTTLASFSRLFKGMGQESLGWLLIDEAGQATPQSVVGALWRSRRAVVIGDPLQIEPVMTVPETVVAKLREHHGVAEHWSPARQSAQTVADRSMAVGTWIGGVWTGLPLRAHRRCIDPMFAVANAIAYAGQMVQANTSSPDFDCVLGESAWFDVPGVRADNHVVAEEMNALFKILIRLRSDWPVLPDGRQAKVYIISPFRDVATAARDILYRAKLQDRVDCGTVHTFQGKEAEIVFIVLGSSPGMAGIGSRDWATKRPNLLNVALTRAKLRVYVIGNYDDWKDLLGFDELVKHLKRTAGAGA